MHECPSWLCQFLIFFWFCYWCNVVYISISLQILHMDWFVNTPLSLKCVYHFIELTVKLPWQVQLVTFIHNQLPIRSVVVSSPVVACNFFVIWMEAIPFILTCLGILWHMCIDHVLKLIYNLCPSLYSRNHIGSWIYKPFLCNIFCLFAFDECKHLIMIPICLAMLNTHVMAQSSFWSTLASSNKIRQNCLHQSQINSPILVLVGVEWKVECEWAKECRDWKSIRRCNM